MTGVCLCFEVHQPLRLRKDIFWGGSPMRRIEPDQIPDFYFDDPENGRIFDRVAEKCYLPTNEIILEEIKRHQDSERPFKAAYSFSGIFLDQCERYNPRVLESFARLVDTGMVQVIERTYHHSLASLYDDGREFAEQVRMHWERVWDAFGVKPGIFENTELLYDDRIAGIVEDMGYAGILRSHSISLFCGELCQHPRLGVEDVPYPRPFCYRRGRPLRPPELPSTLS